MKRLILCLLLVSCLVGCSAPEEKVTAYECETLVFDIEWNDGSPRYNAVIAVKNTGETVIDIGYTEFRVETEDGTLVAVENSSAIGHSLSLIAPGETGYYFAARLELTSKIDMDKTYVLDYDTKYIKAANETEVTNFEVKDVSFPEDDYMEVIGKVVNPTETAEDVDVLILCYNSDDEIVTVGGTIIGVDAHDEAAFEILNFAAFGREDIVRYEIFARKITY